LRKERIYLDTSVISYLDQQDSPEKMQETQIFWELLKLDNYEVLISDIAMIEIQKCTSDKLQKLLEYLDNISYNLIYGDQEGMALANKYIEYAVLTEKSAIDCQHIALASIYECDYITSWNFRHMANVQTMKKVNAINNLEGYKEVKIYPPTEFLYERR